MSGVVRSKGKEWFGVAVRVALALLSWLFSSVLMVGSVGVRFGFVVAVVDVVAVVVGMVELMVLLVVVALGKVVVGETEVEVSMLV